MVVAASGSLRCSTRKSCHGSQPPRPCAGDTARAATSTEVKDLRREARDLKEVVAEQALELRLLKKSMVADGDDDE